MIKLDVYLAQVKAAVGTQISYDEYEKQHQHLAKLKRLLPNLPVKLIQFDQLVGIKNDVLTARKKNGDPYSPDTIKTVMYCFKRFFSYLADSGKWPFPPRYERAFKINYDKLKDEDGGDVDDRDEDDEEQDELETVSEP